VIVGLTASRKDPSRRQLSWLRSRLRGATELHHGACVGGDAAGHHIALSMGIRVVVHPPLDPKWVDKSCLKPHPLVTVLEPKEYIPRNHDMVNAVVKLLALPSGPERMRGSGTWATIRYADGKVPINKCFPDGTVR
jgi:hypothetical protein